MRKLILAIVGIMLLVAAIASSQSSVSNASFLKMGTTTRAWAGGAGQVVAVPGKVVGNTKSYCIGIGSTAASLTLSTTSDFFRVCAVGGTASILLHSASLDATTAVNGHDFVVGDGMCHVVEITETKASVIGGYDNSTPVDAGEICFFPLTSPGGKF